MANRAPWLETWNALLMQLLATESTRPDDAAQIGTGLAGADLPVESLTRQLDRW